MEYDSSNESPSHSSDDDNGASSDSESDLYGLLSSDSSFSNSDSDSDEGLCSISVGLVSRPFEGGGGSGTHCLHISMKISVKVSVH